MVFESSLWRHMTEQNVFKWSIIGRFYVNLVETHSRLFWMDGTTSEDDNFPDQERGRGPRPVESLTFSSRSSSKNVHDSSPSNVIVLVLVFVLGRPITIKKYLPRPRSWSGKFSSSEVVPSWRGLMRGKNFKIKL